MRGNHRTNWLSSRWKSTDIQIAARQSVATAAQRVEHDLADVRLQALDDVRSAGTNVAEMMASARHRAQQDLATARTALESQIATVRLEGTNALTEARSVTKLHLDGNLFHVRHQTQVAREAARRGLHDVGELARRVVTMAADHTEALMREIAGQGPDKTMGRGFAVVRTSEGKTLTRASDARQDQAIQLQFSDGTVNARTSETGESP